MLEDEYLATRADANDETRLRGEIFPINWPFTVEQVMDSEFWPD